MSRLPVAVFAPLLLGLLTAVWGALAVGVADRQTWLLENALLVLFVAALVVSFARFRFSRRAYLLIFVFLGLHAVGGHYTYSLVPYDDWFRAATGESLNARMGWTRNHYDRLLHFLFGLLLAPPARELLEGVAGVARRWSARLAVVLIMACSSLYELIEWAAALVFGGELGLLFLGTQGDPWDGQRDMALAAAGAVLAMLSAAIVSAARCRRSGSGGRSPAAPAQQQTPPTGG